MKAAVFAHCTMDSITVGGASYEQPGGPACYCGITARQMGFDVSLATRFGPDFPAQCLEDAGIAPGGASSSATTRFSIDVGGQERTLRLVSRCEDVGYERIDADFHVASPVCGEISADALREIKRDASFLMVDPQGFLRRAGPGGAVSLADTELDLAGVSALKASPEEARRLASGTNDEMMLQLQKRGVGCVLMTDGKDVSMLEGGRMYEITLPNKDVRDTTGVGDIFCAAFCCTMIRERDPLWALCFAGGAAQAALDSGAVGLQKIPRRGQIQTNASYFYNLVRFRDP